MMKGRHLEQAGGRVSLPIPVARTLAAKEASRTNFGPGHASRVARGLAST